VCAILFYTPCIPPCGLCSEMFARITCSRALQGTAVQQNATAVLFAKRNVTAAATKAVPEDVNSPRPYEEIPGPKPLPVLGNAWRFIPGLGDLHRVREVNFIKELRKKYGDIIKISGIPGRSDIVLLFDADEIEKVFRNEGQWPIRDAIDFAAHYRLVTRKDIFQGVGGLVVTHGETWQKFRTKVNQTMMQPRSTKLYVAPIDAVADDFVERIKILRDDKQEMPADFNNELYKWALESIVYIALDTRLGSLEKDLKPDSEPQKMIDSVQVQFETMYKLEMGLPIWKIYNTKTWKDFVKSSDYFLEVSMKYINKAMKRLETLPEDPDRELTVLEKLLARDPDPKTGIVMAMDMMGAGIDTTSYSSAIALYYLAKNQDKQQILFEEIIKHLPNKNGRITSDTLNQLKYLKACIKESMRITPIAIGNIRQLVKDMVLGGYHVPKGVSVMMPIILLSNDEKYFPNADKFIPERWIKNASPSNSKTHPFAIMPFGFGPRMCVGRRFAELEIETLLTKIIRNFRVEFNYDIKFESKLLYVPTSPLKFKMVDRES
ncbi:hypothetical protein L9F63_012877, partial [Diploptera punctata]